MMVFQVSMLAVLALVCSTVATDVPHPSLVSGLCGQCKDILSTMKTSVLAEMKSVTPDKLPSVMCDLDDKELQTQCTEVLTDNGAALLEFLETVDEGDVCKDICEYLGTAENTDTDLYFQSEDSAVRTDEVGSFVCSICKKGLSFLHMFLTNKKHQGFVLHMLKGFCHYVPLFRTECNVLINMYGRLIINLAARYVSPRLCTTFRLCSSQISNTMCSEPEDIQDGSKTFSDLTTGSTVGYSCNQGYTMELGDRTRTCGEDGQWTGEPPACIKAVEMDI